jgi:hypothetical protein
MKYRVGDLVCLYSSSLWKPNNAWFDGEFLRMDHLFTYYDYLGDPFVATVIGIVVTYLNVMPDNPLSAINIVDENGAVWYAYVDDVDQDETDLYSRGYSAGEEKKGREVRRQELLEKMQELDDNVVKL